MLISGTPIKAIIAGPEGILRQRIGQIIDANGWQWLHVATPNEAARLLRTASDTELILLAPGETVETAVETCRRIKFDPRTRHVSVVCVLGPLHSDRTTDLFESGADDCIRSSESDRELSLRLSKVAAVKRATDSLEDSETIITALAGAIEGKDEYTCGHVDRVATYAVTLGRKLGATSAQLGALQTGGIVHDIGKIGIPDSILNKQGKLTDEEMNVMKRHAAIGYDILKPLRTFKDVLPIVRWHHERPNGTGYPDGLKGDQLPLLPRIISVSDVFDALSTDRPYRKRLEMSECIRILREDAAKGSLDTQVVEAMVDILAPQMASTAA
jgi:putative two-component system response regulator